MAPGFLACLRREAARLRAPWEGASLVGIPLGSLLLVAWIFASGVAHDLPLAIVDEDASSASRRLVRWIDATPGLAVERRPASVEEAWSELRAGRVHGIVHVPRAFSRDLRHGRQGEVTAWLNTQFLTVSNAMARDLQAAVLGFGTSVSTAGRLARGETRSVALVRVEPVDQQRTTLFNPTLDYRPFLVPGLAAAILHMAAILAAVRGPGRELREGTAGAWLASAGNSLKAALMAKALPPTLVLGALGGASLAVWHGPLGWPLAGSGWVLHAGFAGLLAAYAGLGLLVLGLTGGLRMASSVAAFLTAPAFAFGGITFPLDAMPDAALAWSRLLPLTSFLQLQVEQTVRGAPWEASMPELAWLWGAAAAFGGAGALLLRRRIRAAQRGAA